MNKIHYKIIGFFYGLLFLINACAQNQENISVEPKLPENLKPFVALLEKQQKQLQGGAIAILYQGHVVYKSTFGFQNGHEYPVKDTTLFELGSVSKSVSSMAVGLMVDKNKLSYHEVYSLPYLKYPVSLMNILSHTTGYNFPGNTQIEHGVNRDALLNDLAKQSPVCNPGQCFYYSNTLFSLLQEIAKTKNISFHQLIDNLNSILESTHDFVIFPLISHTNIAYPHMKTIINGKESRKILPFPKYYPKVIPSAGGIFASLNGMIKFFNLTFGYRPDLISNNILNAIQTPVIAANDVSTWNFNWPINLRYINSYYAMGWRVFRLKENPDKELIFHGGYIDGYRAYIGYIPNEKVGFIMLVNQSTEIPVQDGMKLWSIYLPASVSKALANPIILGR